MGLFNWRQKFGCSECSKVEEAQRKAREAVNFSKTLVEQIQELETDKMNITNEKIKSLESKLEDEVKKNAKLIVGNDELKEENNKLLTTIQEVRYTNAGLQADIKKLEGIRDFQKSAEEMKSIIEKSEDLEKELEKQVLKNSKLVLDMESNNEQMKQNNIDKEIALKIQKEFEEKNVLLKEKIDDMESLKIKLADSKNELTQETAKRLALEVETVHKEEQITYLNVLIDGLTRVNSRNRRQYELSPGLYVSTRN